jgi:hypothetical protein
VFGVSPSTGTVVALNNFDKEQVDIAARIPGEVFATLNNLPAYGLNLGVANFGSGAVNATSNWWACPDGPLHAGCSRFLTYQRGLILYNPWLPSQYMAGSKRITPRAVTTR